MKQVVQDFKDGKIKVIDAPDPVPEPGFIIVRNYFSAISAGTEKTTVGTGKKSLIGKARARPDLVKKVVENIKREGLGQTLKKVRSKLDEYKLLGYSSAGKVIAMGEGVTNFSPGDVVACGGGNYATHSELIKVPVNLCVKVPDGVGLDEAAFATIGAIAMQGVRQADVRVGERVGVIGLGLIGLLTLQILKASGCRVFGIDVDREAIKRAGNFGLDAGSISGEGIEERVATFTDGFGLDSVIITAGTRSSEPVHTASRILRDRGKVVVVGAVGMELEREPFYMKELSLSLSRSYGPGRYDPVYEEKGIDYPIGYVRWTEQRNMEAFLDLVAQKKINVKTLITHRFTIEMANEAYDLILNRREPFIGVVFEYGETLAEKVKTIEVSPPVEKKEDVIVAGVIGAGSFGKTFIIPALKSNPHVQLSMVATSHGAGAVNVAKRFGFYRATSDTEEILSNRDINTVFILTRHNLHAPYVLRAIEEGKNVYVEKPLAISLEDVERIGKKLKENPVKIMVGFNRRFSLHAERLKSFFGDEHGPLIIHYRVNAGALPPDHWTRDPDIGGGRIIGEGCHFLDFTRFLTGGRITEVKLYPAGDRENAIIVVSFEDGSMASIHYTTTGDKSFPKERVEVIGDGKVGIIDDYRTTILSSGGNRNVFKSKSQDKGYVQEINAFVDYVLGKKGPAIPPEEILEVSEWIIRATMT